MSASGMLTCEDVQILKGVVRQDHVHIYIEYPPSKSLSKLVKRLKGKTSRRVRQEFPALYKQLLGRQFWTVSNGVWSMGSVTAELMQAYLEHHRKPSDNDSTRFTWTWCEYSGHLK